MKYLLLLLGLLGASTLQADEVTPDRARSAAIDFFSAGRTTRGAKPRLERIRIDARYARTSAGTPAFYIFDRTDARGFVIVAGDDASLPVLGYSFSESFAAEPLPENLRWWLTEWCERIDRLRSTPGPVPEAVRSAWERIGSAAGEVVVRHETAQWGQRDPFNALCPSIDGVRAVSGCVPTAMAIVMRFHRWPDRGEGTAPAYSYKIGEATYQVAPRELGHAYDWDLMPLVYDRNATDEARKAVATLMYDCGVAVKAMYNPDGTGAYSSDAIKALQQYMKYDQDAVLLYQTNFTTDQWERRLKTELRCAGPVIFSGSNSSGAGHMFVLDGYNTTDYFSINWGWTGRSNGYFLLPDIEYCKNPRAILALRRPQPGSYDDLLILTTADESDPQREGLMADRPRIVQDKPFRCDTGPLYNAAADPFSGTVAVALCAADGTVREVVSRAIELELQAMESTTLTGIECLIAGAMRPGDRLRLLFRSGTDDMWHPVTGETGVAHEIIVRNGAVDKDTALAYDRTRGSVTLYTLPGTLCRVTAPAGGIVFERRADSGGLIEIAVGSWPEDSYTFSLIADGSSKTFVCRFGAGGQKSVKE